MPRTAKRMQAPVAPQDQGYGVRGEQIASMNQMGIPDNQGVQPVTVPAGEPPVDGGGPAPQMDPAQLLEMLKQQPPPPAGGLARPTDRPNEPLTQGMTGPPPPAKNKAADALDMMAAATGDLRLAALAQRARMI